MCLKIAGAYLRKVPWPLAVKMMREVDQLLKVANYYFGQAESVLSKHQQLESKTIGQITKRYCSRGLSSGEIILAHFASAAVRLATICEIKGDQQTKNYRKMFYEKSGKRRTNWPRQKILGEITSNLHEHIHLLLRDNISHEEPGLKNKKEIAADRFVILKVTTIGSCRKALKKTIRNINDHL